MQGHVQRNVIHIALNIPAMHAYTDCRIHNYYHIAIAIMCTAICVYSHAICYTI